MSHQIQGRMPRSSSLSKDPHTVKEDATGVVASSVTGYILPQPRSRSCIQPFRSSDHGQRKRQRKEASGSQALMLRAMVLRNQTMPELFAGPGAFARPRQSRNAKRKPKRGWPRSPYTQPTSYSNSRPSKEVETAWCDEACAAAFLGEFFLILIGTSLKLHTCFLARKSLFQAWMLVAGLACHLHCSPFLWLVL